MSFKTVSGVLSSVMVMFSIAYPDFALGQVNAPVAGGDIGQVQIRNSPGSVVNFGARRNGPFEFNVHVDALAIVADWRARQPNSQSGTQGRSGIRINGTSVGARTVGRVVLFACFGGAFLDLSFGVAPTRGVITYDDGPGEGCEPRQALVLTGERLSCQWYRPPGGIEWREEVDRAPAERSEIILSTVPPLGILGECITETAHVVPAIPWPAGMPDPAGRRDKRHTGCGGSGVTVNGRATGHSAGCRN